MITKLVGVAGLFAAGSFLAAGPATMGATPVQAGAEATFTLPQDGKDKDAKDAKAPAKTKDGKAKEGSCGKGSCGSKDKKAKKDGSCGKDKKEGSCGKDKKEGSCGKDKKQ